MTKIKVTIEGTRYTPSWETLERAVSSALDGSYFVSEPDWEGRKHERIDIPREHDFVAIRRLDDKAGYREPGEYEISLRGGTLVSLKVTG